MELPSNVAMWGLSAEGRWPQEGGLSDLSWAFPLCLTVFPWIYSCSSHFHHVTESQDQKRLWSFRNPACLQCMNAALHPRWVYVHSCLQWQKAQLVMCSLLIISPRTTQKVEILPRINLWFGYFIPSESCLIFSRGNVSFFKWSCDQS